VHGIRWHDGVIGVRLTSPGGMRTGITWRKCRQGWRSTWWASASSYSPCRSKCDGASILW
jgi:hypothetical protein